MTSNEKLNRPRRIWLRVVAGAAIGAPFGIFVTQAVAVQNGTDRGFLKYQDAPNGRQDCAGCAEFVPGKTPKDRGGCTLIPGDTEISPSGWCVAWVPAKK